MTRPGEAPALLEPTPEGAVTHPCGCTSTTYTDPSYYGRVVVSVNQAGCRVLRPDLGRTGTEMAAHTREILREAR